MSSRVPPSTCSRRRLRPGRELLFAQPSYWADASPGWLARRMQTGANMAYALAAVRIFRRYHAFHRVICETPYRAKTAAPRAMTRMSSDTPAAGH